MSVSSLHKQCHVSFILQVHQHVYVFTSSYDNHAAEYTRTMNGTGSEYSTLLWSHLHYERIDCVGAERKDLLFSHLLAECFSCAYSAGTWGRSGASLFGSGTATAYFMTFRWNLLSLPGHKTKAVEMCFSEAWTRKTVQGYESHCISAVWWGDQGRGPSYGALAHLVALMSGLTWLPVYFFAVVLSIAVWFWNSTEWQR